MKPVDYLKIRKVTPQGIKDAEVDVERIMGVIGGPAKRGELPRFQLELTNKAQRRQLVDCEGGIDDVKATFNRLGVNNFLWFTAVLNPLTGLASRKMQDSAVRIERIAEIRRLPGRRKGKSAISRTGLPDVLVRDDLTVLANRIFDQGYRGSGVANPNIFVLHPQHQVAAPPVPPVKRAKKLKNPNTPQKALF